MSSFTIRSAVPEDTGLILSFIRKLAAYENMLDDVVADIDTLRRTLFEQRYAESIIGEEDGVPVGFALFFHNFSTFLGRPGIHLEDIFVDPSARGKGYGKALLAHVASIAVERGCQRLEWACLDWNTPSQEFYESFGAIPLNEWIVYRLTGSPLQDLANLR